MNVMAIRTGAVYGALLLRVGVLLPFLPVWLSAKGFSVSDIAIALACQSIVRVTFMPVVSYLADKYRARRRFILVLTCLACVFMVLAVLSSSVLAITTLIVLSATCWGPVVPMLDAVAVEQAEHGHYEYGHVRIAGSVTFIIGSLGAGAMLGFMEAVHLGWVLVGVHVLLALSGFALPRLGAAKEAGAVSSPLTLSSARKVLLTSGFGLLIMVAGLTQASHAVYYGFGSLHWENLGYSGITIGTLWSIGVVSEIILFLYAKGSIARFGPVLLLMGGAGFGIIRWGVMAFDPPLAAIVALQVLHAASYGMTHLGTIYYIRRFVASDYAGTAQGLFGAISGGIIMTLAIALAGWAYAGMASIAYLFMAGLCLAAFVLSLLLRRLTP